MIRYQGLTYMAEYKALKVDPLLVYLSYKAKVKLSELDAPRSLALANILDEFDLWYIKTPQGEVAWGQGLYERLKTREIAKALKRLGDEAKLGLVVDESKPISLEEALRKLGVF